MKVGAPHFSGGAELPVQRKSARFQNGFTGCGKKVGARDFSRASWTSSPAKTRSILKRLHALRKKSDSLPLQVCVYRYDGLQWL